MLAHRSPIDGKLSFRSESCVRSPNFPDAYDDDDSCTIVLSGAATVSSYAFETESPHDYLQIDDEGCCDGEVYCGGSGNGIRLNRVPVAARSTIEWNTDGSVALVSNGVSGFELCVYGQRFVLIIE